MTDSHAADAHLYAHVHRLLQDHERMLADGPRNTPFYAALERTVTPGAHVLDIGSGTGLWAVAAAVLGAARAVAIEQDPLLRPVIEALARENGVADRVEVVVGHSAQVELGRTFGVVVTETIGNLGFDEQIVAITRDARARFLKPGGALIPETVALRAAPAHLSTTYGRLPAGLSLGYRSFEALARHAPVGLTPGTRLELLAEPQTLIDVDLTTAEAEPDLHALAARWALPDAGPVDCFAVWAESRLTGGVPLTTRGTSSWSPVLYRIEPFGAGAATLALTLSLTATTNAWTVAHTPGGADRGKAATRAYGPPHAATALLEIRRADTPSAPQLGGTPRPE